MSEEMSRETKNAIFGTNPATQQMANLQKNLKDSFNIEIPTEIVPLPSNGLVYPPDSPFGRLIISV